MQEAEAVASGLASAGKGSEGQVIVPPPKAEVTAKPIRILERKQNLIMELERNAVPFPQEMTRRLFQETHYRSPSVRVTFCAA